MLVTKQAYKRLSDVPMHRCRYREGGINFTDLSQTGAGRMEIPRYLVRISERPGSQFFLQTEQQRGFIMEHWRTGGLHQNRSKCINVFFLFFCTWSACSFCVPGPRVPSLYLVCVFLPIIRKLSLYEEMNEYHLNINEFH